MFDALQPFIIIAVVSLVAFVLTALADIFGLKIESGTWANLLAQAIAVGITLWLNTVALKLPVFVQAYIPLVVQAIILFLTSIGFVTALSLSHRTVRAYYATLKKSK